MSSTARQGSHFRLIRRSRARPGARTSWFPRRHSLPTGGTHGYRDHRREASPRSPTQDVDPSDRSGGGRRVLGPTADSVRGQRSAAGRPRRARAPAMARDPRPRRLHADSGRRGPARQADRTDDRLGPYRNKHQRSDGRSTRALDRKGARYGSPPPYPLVIALAIEEPGVEDGDIAAALFGRVVMQILDTDSDPMPVRHYREDDGYWSGRRNAGSRVSAVVTTRYPRLWSAAALEPHLWLNPWAQRP
jgi:hypothetical protein